MTIKNGTLRSAVSAIAVAGLLTSLTACNNVLPPNQTNNSYDYADSTPSVVITSGDTSLTETFDNSENTELKNNSHDHADSTTSVTTTTGGTNSADSFDNSENTELKNDSPIYDGVFEGTNGNYVQGPPMTYDEIADILKSDAEHPEWDLDSFFLVETIGVLSIDECRALAGWDDMYSDRTMYRVKVINDLISGETVNKEENIFISMGNVQWQNDGDPIYAPGEKFTVALTKPYEGCDFLRTPGAFALRYDAIESDDGITLYSRNSGIDQLNLMSSENINERIVTSTTKNPVVRTQTLELDALTDFLRSDWEQRGISSHYERTVS